MAEQNAHDDERGTADLAAGDTADLAIDDATDLAAADTARPQTPAEQLTPAGRAVSPSPSPTPTFAATDRPARRARRLRWKPGITRPMMALSAASFALMVAGVGGYVSAIPAVVAGDKPGAVVIPLESALWLDGQMREVQAGPANSTRAVGPLTVEGSKTDAAAPDAAAALGLGSSSGMLGVASLTGASAASSVDSSFTRAQQIAGASAASGSGSASGSAASGGSLQAGSGSAGSGSASGSGSGSGGSGSGGSGSASGDTGGSDSGSESAGRLRFRTCACRPHGRAGGGGICCAGQPSGSRELLCCAREQRRGRVQQRLHEHVAFPSPKRLQGVHGHRWTNAHRLPDAAQFERVRRRVALAGAEGKPSASLHRAGSVFDRHLQRLAAEFELREPGGRG